MTQYQNKVSLIGKLNSKPNLRVTKKNTHFITFAIAIPRKDAKFTDYINCICWDDQLAQYIAQNAVVGDEIFVAGSIQSNSYQNSQNVKCYSHEIGVKQFRINMAARKQVQQQSQTPQGYNNQTAPNAQSTMPNANFNNNQANVDNLPVPPEPEEVTPEEAAELDQQVINDGLFGK